MQDFFFKTTTLDKNVLIYRNDTKQCTMQEKGMQRCIEEKFLLGNETIQMKWCNMDKASDVQMYRHAKALYVNFCQKYPQFKTGASIWTCTIVLHVDNDDHSQVSRVRRALEPTF